MPQQTFNLDAKILWQSTNINVNVGDIITIKADPNDRWTANPLNGPYDARGLQGVVAKGWYCYGGGTEGSLVAMIYDIKTGGRQYEEIKLEKTFTALIKGLLSISINDDTEKAHGKGFWDNVGYMNVTIDY